MYTYMHDSFYTFSRDTVGVFEAEAVSCSVSESDKRDTLSDTSPTIFISPV